MYFTLYFQLQVYLNNSTLDLIIKVDTIATFQIK